MPALAQQPCFAVFEDTLAEPRQLVLLRGLHSVIELTVTDALEEVFERIDAARAQGLWVVIAAHYELGYTLEPKLRDLIPRTAPTTLLKAWLFSDRIDLAGESLAAFWAEELQALPAMQREAGLLSLQAAWTSDKHATATTQILQAIRDGECYQVNLTMPLNGEFYGHPLALYTRLRAEQSVAYSTLLRDGDDWILSLSPELFVERTQDTLTCRPMKGTAARGRDAFDDDTRGRALLASEKNRAENLMIVDLIRNDLGKLAPAGGVKTLNLFQLERYETVFQLTSTIRATAVTAPLPEILAALFPCGSITGAPKIRAMQIIAEQEAAPRGLYCGALGWLAPTGDFRFSVPIRTLLATPDRRIRLDVGSGIVADSDPAAEYQESLLKASFARRLTEDVQLIETLRWEPGAGIPLLPRHLARLARSALALGFDFRQEAFSRALAGATDTLPPHPHRIRAVLGRRGEITITVAPLEPLGPDPRVCLADDFLDPADPRLRYKTTARAFYDQALARALAHGCFDLLYFNTRGELCEGARSNVFIERDGQLLTPPCHSGLLPGVMREQLLDDGRAHEALLYRDDLLHADRVWISNALRGLVAVRCTGSTLPSD